MSSIWDFKDTLFRALAAACAALGEESFRSQLRSIAEYYGDGATFHEVETLFTKDVPAKAEQLKIELANRHGCRRNSPSRGSARLHRPPLLDFDDEDLSILSPREVEILKVRSKNSLQAPAKRLRVVEGSPPISRANDVPATEATAPQKRPGITQMTTSKAARNKFERGPANPDGPDTGRNPTDCFAQQSVSQPRKRRFSEVHDSVELQTAGRSSPSTTTPPRSESFGYVTKNGEYRCALCQRQLPNENDLKLHEQIGEEHTRSLKDRRKVIIGRERLAQHTAVLAGGQNASSPVLDPRLRIHDLLESSPRPAAAVECSEVGENGNSHDREPSVRRSQDRQVSPAGIDEKRRLHLSTAPIQQSADDAASASAAGPSQPSDRGKCRAASLASLSDDTPYPRATPASAAGMYTRPTTAQTEIGTLNTPHISQHVDSAVTQQPHDIETSPDDEMPELSPSTIKDIMRSTGLTIQLLNSFRNCVSARVNEITTSADPGPAPVPDSRPEPHLTGIRSTSPIGNSAVPTTLVLETLDEAASSSGVTSSGGNCKQGTISAPGIGVRYGIKRRDRTENGKKKDVGEPISVIVLD
ncbi:hypothetical protein CLAIMM_04378 [Cladophialophora immunda]|nr:hypothetical protein CLAIMM_04378 [Cladophialophora immunda]